MMFKTSTGFAGFRKSDEDILFDIQVLKVFSFELSILFANIVPILLKQLLNLSAMSTFSVVKELFSLSVCESVELLGGQQRFNGAPYELCIAFKLFQSASIKNFFEATFF